MACGCKKTAEKAEPKTTKTAPKAKADKPKAETKKK